MRESERERELGRGREIRAHPQYLLAALATFRSLRLALPLPGRYDHSLFTTSLRKRERERARASESAREGERERERERQRERERERERRVKETM